MYEAFFKLNERPFAAAPVSARYFPAEAIENARQTLGRTIDRAEGVGLLVGPSGTGKSLLLQVLADQFRDRFLPVVLSSGRLATARAFLQAVLFELNLPYRHMDEGELRLSLVDHLSPGKLNGDGMLLLVDEAHTMSVRLLEELRMITNLMRGGEPRVRVILAGSPKLEERFASPRLDAFAQRLSARCYLESFNRDETFNYVRCQIEMVGGNGCEVFKDDALSAIYRATDGIPRLVNQVCDHALLLASLGGVSSLDAAGIEEAWADLQQLPAPWNAGGMPKLANTQIVEFGSLDDSEDHLREAIPFPTANAEVHLATADSAATAEIGPEEQLCRIEAHLQELTNPEADFQPVGSIRPEVELVFHRGNSPFGGEFHEEEVVLDRYASLEASVFDQRPLVTSREGRELGAMLAPHSRPVAEMTLPLKPAAAEARNSAESSRRDFAQVTSEPTMNPAADLYAEDADDADLIIIEDDPQVPPTKPPLVRKQEYRQLFAKLRRG